MNGDLIVQPTWAATVGWCLIHFVWQGAAIGLAVEWTLWLVPSRAAAWRYVLACCGLVAMAAAPWLTAFALRGDLPSLAPRPHPAASRSEILPGMAAERSDPPTTSRSQPDNGPATTAGEGDSTNQPMTASWWRRRVESSMHWIVWGWSLGAATLALRTAAGLFRVRAWRDAARPIQLAAAHDLLARMAKRLGIRFPVELLETARLSAPAAIGWLKPAILIPPSMVTGLSPSELESVIAHELAHIRRRDYLINLLQTLVEALLFYHPAVWRVSWRIRAEREHCCDDLAVAACGDAIAFAKALTRMEELRMKSVTWAPAFSGGSLLSRIGRLTGRPAAPSRWPGGLLALATALAVSGLLSMNAGAVANATPATPEPRPQDSENEPIPPRYKAESKITDRKTGIKQHVFADIVLSCGEGETHRNVKLAMKYSNVIRYSFVPERLAKQLEAVEVGEIDFGPTAPKRPDEATFGQAPFLSLALGGASVAPQDREAVDTDPESASAPAFVNQFARKFPKGTKFTPNDNSPIWTPGHLGFYGMNSSRQHRFRVVRIDQVELGVGPAFGPVHALVLNDENSDFGLLGADWAREVRGKHGEGLWHSAQGAFHFASRAEMSSAGGGGSLPTPQLPKASAIPFQYQRRDGKIRWMGLVAQREGRSPRDVLEKLRSFPPGGTADSFQDNETLISAESGRVFADSVEAQEIIFNLPEGSGIRAEMRGGSITVRPNPDGSSKITIRDGKIKLIDAGGVVRAWASPDGGADLLIVQCQKANDEYALRLRTGRTEPDPDYPQPPVQCVMNVNTGAPADEKDPPHGAIRYRLQAPDDREGTFRMKMSWHYDVERLRQGSEDRDATQPSANTTR